jgi:hypothetical protein
MVQEPVELRLYWGFYQNKHKSKFKLLVFPLCFVQHLKIQVLDRRALREVFRKEGTVDSEERTVNNMLRGRRNSSYFRIINGSNRF